MKTTDKSLHLLRIRSRYDSTSKLLPLDPGDSIGNNKGRIPYARQTRTRRMDDIAAERPRQEKKNNK